MAQDARHALQRPVNPPNQNQFKLVGLCPTTCPTAQEAALFLTGNNPDLTITDATLTSCTGAPQFLNTVIVTNWTGTAFAPTFEKGKGLNLGGGVVF
jgi:hypothetical protein